MTHDRLPRPSNLPRTSNAVGYNFEVLIVAYRTVDLLEKAIASVRAHLKDVTIRVWDNSGPGHSEVSKLSKEHPDIDWHLGSSNIGFAAAVNKLVAMGSSRHFLLLNPDAQLLSDLRETRRLISDDSVAAVAPFTIDALSRGRRSIRPWDVAHRHAGVIRALVDHAWYSPQLRGTPLSSLYSSPPHEVAGYLTGACLMINRGIWNRVGGFDSTEFFLYGEEVDWQKRARDAGWRLLLAKEPGVAHRGHGTVGNDPRAGLRSADLLRAGIALNIERSSTVHHGDAYLAGTSILDRVQRSARRRRAALAMTYVGDKPAVIVTVNRLVYGGAERHHVVLATELARRGYPVTIVCMQRFGPLISEVDSDIRVVRQPWWAPLIDLPDAPANCKPTNRVRAVAITGDTNTETGFGTLWRTNHSDRRWLTAAHWYPKLDQPTYSTLLAKAMSRSDGFIALSQAHWDGLTRHQFLGNRHFIAPNGVVSAEAVNHIPEAEVRVRGPIRLAMLARIVELKNPHILTAALARVPDHLDWTLDIFGDGPDRERLEALTPDSVADRVRWRGWSPGPDHALAEADLLCCPSGTEAFPMVILEAMARGIPVMATSVCSVPKMLDNGNAGFLVPTPSVEDWAQALTEILSDPTQLPKVGSIGRSRMVGHYTVDSMVDAYEAAIRAVL